MKVLLVAFLILFLQLTIGKIHGNCSGKIYDAFTNIPYAKTPVGDRRFESPHPICKWQGIRAATGTPATCIEFNPVQNVEMFETEDCLKIHVYVPKRERQSKELHGSLIVLVHLATGLFQFGSPTNDPARLVEAGDAMVVVVAYRNGPLGFLSMQDKDLPGNMGLKDQRLALKVIEKNVAAFGGDPKKMILFGGAAGGASVEFQMIAGNFNAAAYATLGTSAFSSWVFTKKPRIAAVQLAKKLKCPVSDSRELKKCLKQHSLKEIWNAVNQLHIFYGFTKALFRPTIEPECVADAFITKDLPELIKEVKNIDKPFLITATKGSGAYPVGRLTQLNKDGVEALTELNKRWYELCPLMFFFYESMSKSQQIKACEELRTQFMCNKPFNLHTYKLLEIMAGHIYTYKGIEQSAILHRQSGRKVFGFVADLPTTKTFAHLFNNRLDLCFGSGFIGDVIGIMPIVGRLPAERTPIQEHTYNNLVKSIKSLISDQPKYKNLNMPANRNDSVPHMCVYLTFGDEYVAECIEEEPNCECIESVICHHDPMTKHNCNKFCSKKYN